jgi:1,2-diacylglycerol 3-alpha-glucosyltransferase
MRIGLFTDTYPPYINGVSTSVSMLKKALEKEGHQVFLVTSNDDNHKYCFEENNKVIRIPGIKTWIYGYRLTKVYPIRLLKTIKKWRLDVIHSHTEFGVGTFARIVAKQFNIPLVHTYHTMYEDYVHYVTRGYFNHSSRKIVEYLTLFYCDKTATELIVPTKKTYDLFKEKYQVNRNVHIVPTGIEVERFYKENINFSKLKKIKTEYNLSDQDFVLIFVGRLAEEKNVIYLLNIIKDVYKDIKNIKLLIVGDGPDKEKFIKHAKKIGIEKQTIFTGFVPWEEVPLYYHLADAFITPSTSETQGLTVIEAMAAEKIPICINDDAFNKVVINGLNGYLFNDPKECEKIIKDVYYNQDNKNDKLKNQARITAEENSSKTYATNALRVYRHAIRNKKGRFGFLSKIIETIRR